MLDVNLIRDNPELIKKNLQKRSENTGIIDKFLDLDKEWRYCKQEIDNLRSLRTEESKKIAELKKKGEDIDKQREKVKKIADDLDKKEEEFNELEETRKNILYKIPNILDNDVPYGNDDEENVEVRKVGDIPNFSFEPRNHQQICEMNDWYDLERAAKNSGARFYYLKNEIVLLESALYNYILSKLNNKGYIPMFVPPMLREEIASKVIPLSDFDETIYKISSDDENLFLIGTSEHTLAAFHRDETLNYKDLPIKYAALSPCFRKEAGVTKDSKGIFRVHNFNKIEQFIYCEEQHASDFLNEILNNSEEIFQELEIPYRVVGICSGDIGKFSARSYDIEAWIPSQQNYREMVSASNYRDYGARRLNCRYQDRSNNTKFVNTLNSTTIALPRAIIALIENHQTEDGNVKLPKVLQNLLNKKYLKLN